MKTAQTASLLALLLLGACLHLSANEQTYIRLDKKALEQKRQTLLASQASRKAMDAKTQKIEAYSQPKNVFNDSIILSANGFCTLVPKGAILHLPAKHSSKIVPSPEGRIIAFPEFLRKNIAWLNIREVSLKQAVGDQPLDERTKKACLDSGRVVVTTLQKSPASTKLSRF